MKSVLVATGGYGVDLFFVLSGFLVAGLLFNEYKKTGTALTGRFLIRRGFKIYPAFYFYLVVIILSEAFYFKRTVHTSTVSTELFFLQSYGNPFQFHTWSLAVEEHFYFFLSLLIFLSVKFGWIEKRNAVISFLIAAILLVLTLRFFHRLNAIYPRAAFFQTHLRCDGLLTGALLSYLFYFNSTFVEKILVNRRLLYVAGFLFIAPAFLFDTGGFFMMTIGFNLLHIGFALFILLFAVKNHESSIFRKRYIKTIAVAICFVGINSYSIYLWHLLVENYIDDVIPENSPLNIVTFIIVAITVGLISSYLIEKKFLAIRDKYFPRPVS